MDLEQLLLKVSMDTISGVWILQGNNYRFAFVADHDDLSRSAGQSLYISKQSMSENPLAWFAPALSIFGNCLPDTRLLLLRLLSRTNVTVPSSLISPNSLFNFKTLFVDMAFTRNCETRHLVLQKTLCHTQWLPCRRLAFQSVFPSRSGYFVNNLVTNMI
jgi:hypothetical protein